MYKRQGIDLSSQMIEKAKHQLKNKATLVVGDSENLPFFDQTFDIVYCNDSFHHYPNPQKAIAEIYRVLKIGGTLIIGDTYLPVIEMCIRDRNCIFLMLKKV